MICVRSLLLMTLLLLATAGAGRAEEAGSVKLADGLRPLLQCVTGECKAFTFTAEIEAPIDGKPQKIDVLLRLHGNGDYHLAATHADYSFLLNRTAETTTFALPHHQVAYLGSGETHTKDHLAASEILTRMLTADTSVSTYFPLWMLGADNLLSVLSAQLKPKYIAAENAWNFDDQVTLGFNPGGSGVVAVGDVRVEFGVSSEEPNAPEWTVPDGFEVVEIEREELERHLSRGMRRTLEILAPSERLKSPREKPAVIENGELRWMNGQRVVLLSGTPEEVGVAHARLLRREAMKTIDSVLYAFGTVNTIRTGRWFKDDLSDAYARLSPHIPDDHKRETAAMAETLGIDIELAQALNVFPELFHCSGFAVFDSATADGTLYHGRVLDYMTTIGLQDGATTFVVAIDGKQPFVNVGYAGFIGSVTGMNAAGISLGEMGGRGEGEWDGVPMATLMRRALEECTSLQEVMTLWETSPRTCEYYYVFADGKTNKAVGVAATPEAIEFVHPGQAHERLGPGIKDAVVLSAGSRLETLRSRVKERHGRIDEETAIWLMSRPVAMESNLHNALFVPAKGIVFVANASHKAPAAKRPYVRLDLNELLESMQPESTPATEEVR
ncbi:C45 family autoproteolytic acyltransferase/hydolase [Rubinisphaera margarita]|uniref:C45 family autoproteolytic acyltransferase/hydolase n=1 Tax=Rubinisphaera margarita TaxID=2909586 RepID=UPI001EE95396|nr:C45 family peptidase [Rubinisphaera margarita]MCG6156741.1 C45 family autoproteolytic acyltransferase/hydrolase [Rubinisphaera margarita]